MNKAAEVCGGPYQIIDRASESTGAVVNQYGGNAVVHGSVKRTLIVECE